MSLTINFKNRDALTLSEINSEQSNSDNQIEWLLSEQQKHLDAFKKLPLPSRKVEHWKYNPMSLLLEQEFQLIENLASLDKNNQKHLPHKVKLNDCLQLDFVNGVLVTDLDSLKEISGLTITPLSSLNNRQQKVIQKQLNNDKVADNLFNHFNQCINQNTLLIEVDANVVIDQPIYIHHLSNGSNVASLSSQKTFVHLNQSSQLTLVEQFNSQTSSNIHLALQQTLVSLDNNSHCSHYRLNLETPSAYQISQVKGLLSDDATITGFYLGLGSQLNRTDVDVLFQGKNCESHLTGAYLPAGDQTIDYHTNIEHQMPYCNSKEVFRGIIGDQASATFNGKIHIFPDAQKSNAYLNNKNLLLSNQAEINTKPELEIYADDVVCAHGATVAQLDEQAIYYLQSRGINRQQAKKILSIAFIQELLNKISIEPLKDHLCALLDKHMSDIS